MAHKTQKHNTDNFQRPQWYGQSPNLKQNTITRIKCQQQWDTTSEGGQRYNVLKSAKSRQGHPMQGIFSHLTNRSIFGRSYKCDMQWYFLHQKHRILYFVLSLWSLMCSHSWYDDGIQATMTALGSTGSIRSLIPVGFIREQALIAGIYMRDPGNFQQL